MKKPEINLAFSFQDWTTLFNLFFHHVFHFHFTWLSGQYRLQWSIVQNRCNTCSTILKARDWYWRWRIRIRTYYRNRSIIWNTTLSNKVFYKTPLYVVVFPFLSVQSAFVRVIPLDRSLSDSEGFSP